MLNKTAVYSNVNNKTIDSCMGKHKSENMQNRAEG